MNTEDFQKAQRNRVLSCYSNAEEILEETEKKEVDELEEEKEEEE